MTESEFAAGERKNAHTSSAEIRFFVPVTRRGSDVMCRDSFVSSDYNLNKRKAKTKLTAEEFETTKWIHAPE